MNRLVRIMIAAVAATFLISLWYTALPEIFRSGVPAVTEDADFALLVRLTGFVVMIAVAFYFAARNLLK